MSKSTPALKSCPHCGGEAERYSIESDHGRKHYVWCGADDDAWCGTTTMNFSTPMEADVAWNRRTVDRAALVELYHRLDGHLRMGHAIRDLDPVPDHEVVDVLARALGLDP